MLRVASVAMNGTMRPRLMSTALSRPTAAPDSAQTSVPTSNVMVSP